LTGRSPDAGPLEIPSAGGALGAVACAVGDAAPVGLGGKLDQLRVAVGLALPQVCIDVTHTFRLPRFLW
jgi:hypothetical protein